MYLFIFIILFYYFYLFIYLFIYLLLFFFLVFVVFVVFVVSCFCCFCFCLFIISVVIYFVCFVYFFFFCTLFAASRDAISLSSSGRVSSKMTSLRLFCGSLIVKLSIIMGSLIEEILLLDHASCIHVVFFMLFFFA